MRSGGPVWAERGAWRIRRIARRRGLLLATLIRLTRCTRARRQGRTTRREQERDCGSDAGNLTPCHVPSFVVPAGGGTNESLRRSRRNGLRCETSLVVVVTTVRTQRRGRLACR